MNIAKERAKNSYTYADYLKFSNEERCEIIEGVVYAMSPAPVRKHQEISGNFYALIWNYLKGKSCSVYSAPFDVRLGEKNDKFFEIKNVVQPDLSIICDQDKLDDKGCLGTPDWIIEILSPATAKNDLQKKFKLYEKFGVKEYWIVEPNEPYIMVYQLEHGKYQFIGNYVSTDYLKPKIFKDLEIDLAEVFGIEREMEKEAEEDNQ
jgi:Uma2 family endonuclease